MNNLSSVDYILIPTSTFLDQSLNDGDRLLLGFILGGGGATDLTNEELAWELAVTPKAISRRIHTLQDEGYLHTAKGEFSTRILVGNPIGHSLYVTDVHNVLNDASSSVGVTSVVSTSFKSKPKVSTAKENKEMLQADVTEVFGYWNEKRRQVYNNRGIKTRSAKLTVEREKKIIARLNSGKSTQEIMDAIDGCLTSEYHINNGYIDVSLICRNDEKLEAFIFRNQKLSTSYARGSEEFVID